MADGSNGGRPVACEIVWAQIAGLFPSTNAAREAMGGLGVEYAPAEAINLPVERFLELYRELIETSKG